MFSLLYDTALCLLALLALPKLLWQRLASGKYRHSLRYRLGIELPEFFPKQGAEVIWIHAPSMGETRAIIALYNKLRQAYPHAALVLSSTTETGQQEARRSMPDAQAHFFLPLDISWSIRRIMERIKPTLLILCESDIWYNLLHTAKSRGVKVALVNGKISLRSCHRFQKVPFFTRRLFSQFDLLCLQSQLHYQRFLAMGLPSEKMVVTGNLKFDTPIKRLPPLELQALRGRLSATSPLLVIGSTHAPEEEWILAALSDVWEKIPTLKVLLVPRHPERFNEVASLIQKKGLPFERYTENKKTDARLILIDAMGLLTQCYQIADLALVGGSFAPHIGGHNIFEPVSYNVPVLFGPHMHNQTALKELILSAGAGEEVTLEHLPQLLIKLLESPPLRAQYVSACQLLVPTVQGATQRTLTCISQLQAK